MEEVRQFKYLGATLCKHQTMDRESSEGDTDEGCKWKECKYDSIEGYETILSSLFLHMYQSRTCTM